MEEIAEGHVIPEAWRRRYCNAIVRRDLSQFEYILQICDDKIFFPIESSEGCPCWFVRIETWKPWEIIGYPQCKRLAERIFSGTCDCINTKHSRLVWFSSMHLACYYGQLEIVKHLLQFYKTAAEFQENALLTPLMVTSLSDAKEVAPSIASLLIEGGAAIDEKEENGFTALHFAVINNNAELVKLYLQRGGSVNSLAYWHIIVDNAKSPSVETSGISPLWLATKFVDSTDCEELLLAAGADVTDCDSCYCPLYAVVCKRGLDAALRYIRSTRFDINLRFPITGNHLMKAVDAYFSSGDEYRSVWIEIIKYYLVMGIDVNIEDEGLLTAIYWPACNRHCELTELLVSYGANVNQASCDGITPLMHALNYPSDIPNASEGARNYVHLLLESGANPNAVDDYGFSALFYGITSGEQDVSHVKILLDYNADMGGVYSGDMYDSPKSLLYVAYDSLNFNAAELFLEYGYDIAKENWLLDTEHLPKGLIGNSDLYNDLLELYQNPMDLQVLCRIQLRRLLGRHIRKAVTKLGLPKALENFITFK